MGRWRGDGGLLDLRGSLSSRGGSEGGRGARRPGDPPALIAELQRLLLVLFHLGPQPLHSVLELRVLLPEAARLARTRLRGALRGAGLARAAPILGRKDPGEVFSGGAKAEEAQRAPDVPRKTGDRCSGQPPAPDSGVTAGLQVFPL